MKNLLITLKKWICVSLFILNLFLIGAAVILSLVYFFADWRLPVSLICLFVLLAAAWLQLNYYDKIIEKAFDSPRDITVTPWIVTDSNDNIIFRVKQPWEVYDVGDIVVHKYNGIRKIAHITRSEIPEFNDHILLEISPWSSYSLGSTENIRHATADEILQFIRDREDEEEQRID